MLLLLLRRQGWCHDPGANQQGTPLAPQAAVAGGEAMLHSCCATADDAGARHLGDARVVRTLSSSVVRACLVSCSWCLPPRGAPPAHLGGLQGKRLHLELVFAVGKVWRELLLRLRHASSACYHLHGVDAAAVPVWAR